MTTEDDEVTEEDVAVALKTLEGLIEAGLEEYEGFPVVLVEVKYTRTGRMVAYFDWDADEDDEEED